MVRFSDFLSKDDDEGETPLNHQDDGGAQTASAQAWHNIMGGLKGKSTTPDPDDEQSVSDSPSPHAQTMETPIGDDLFGPLAPQADDPASLPSAPPASAHGGDTMDGLLDQHFSEEPDANLDTRSALQAELSGEMPRPDGVDGDLDSTFASLAHDVPDPMDEFNTLLGNADVPAEAPALSASTDSGEEPIIKPNPISGFMAALDNSGANSDEAAGAPGESSVFDEAISASPDGGAIAHDQTLRDIMQHKTNAVDADTQAMKVTDVDDLLSNTGDNITAAGVEGDGSVTNDDLDALLGTSGPVNELTSLASLEDTTDAAGSSDSVSANDLTAPLTAHDEGSGDLLFSESNESNEGDDDLDALLGEPVAPAPEDGQAELADKASAGGIQDDLDELLGGEGDLDAELGNLLFDDMGDNTEETAEPRDFSTGVHTMLVDDPDQAIADAMAELEKSGLGGDPPNEVALESPDTPAVAGDSAGNDLDALFNDGDAEEASEVPTGAVAEGDLDALLNDDAPAADAPVDVLADVDEDDLSALLSDDAPSAEAPARSGADDLERVSTAESEGLDALDDLLASDGDVAAEATPSTPATAEFDDIALDELKDVDSLLLEAPEADVSSGASEEPAPSADPFGDLDSMMESLDDTSAPPMSKEEAKAEKKAQATEAMNKFKERFREGIGSKLAGVQEKFSGFAQRIVDTCEPIGEAIHNMPGCENIGFSRKDWAGYVGLSTLMVVTLHFIVSRF